VILTGFALTILLVILKNPSFKFTFNISTKQSKTVPIQKSTLLQFNATIIAGLFILLTIQGAVNDNDIFVFLDEITSQKIQDEYQKIMNDTSLDPELREEAKKRFIEIKLNSARDLVKINRDYETKVAKSILSPLTYYLVSIIMMVFSSLTVMYSKEGGLGMKMSELLAILGLMVILIGTYFLLTL
jgi:hypothetical protein